VRISQASDWDLVGELVDPASPTREPTAGYKGRVALKVLRDAPAPRWQ
jgi:hypothetical protein